MRSVTPQEAKELVDSGRAGIIDIREPNEYVRSHIPGAKIVPLSVIKTQELDEGNKDLIFHCRSGKRTQDAAELLESKTGESRHALLLEGGLSAWEKAGLPVEKKDLPPELMRQVQIGAGSLVLLGLAGALVWPPAVYLSAFVGAGLVFAGISGFCGLAVLLRKAPWNKEI